MGVEQVLSSRFYKGTQECSFWGGIGASEELGGSREGIGEEVG